jgi:hypothetical protein
VRTPLNPRRRLLDRSSPKLSRRTQSTPGSDLGCHHLHHQVVDLSEGHLTIIVLRPDRLRSSFRPSGVIRTYSQGELPFFYTFALYLTASDLVSIDMSLEDIIFFISFFSGSLRYNFFFISLVFGRGRISRISPHMRAA